MHHEYGRLTLATAGLLLTLFCVAQWRTVVVITPTFLRHFNDDLRFNNCIKEIEKNMFTWLHVKKIKLIFFACNHYKTLNHFCNVLYTAFVSTAVKEDSHCVTKCKIKHLKYFRSTSTSCRDRFRHVRSKRGPQKGAPQARNVAQQRDVLRPCRCVLRMECCGIQKITWCNTTFTDGLYKASEFRILKSGNSSKTANSCCEAEFMLSFYINVRKFCEGP